MAMRIKCSDCPRTKKYINLGSCPVCFAKPMLLDIRTHNAKCNECGAEFGVPMAVEGLCAEDIRNRRYCVTIQSKPKKQDMLEIANFYIERNQSDRLDYAEKYEKVLKMLEDAKMKEVSQGSASDISDDVRGKIREELKAFVKGAE